MPQFDGPNLLITLDDPTVGVLNISVEADLYSDWKEWTLGNYFFDTEDDVNGGTERITYINHSLHTGQEVIYTTEGGAENIGLVNNTTYYVRYIDRNTLELYDTKVNAEGDPATVGRLNLTASGVGNGELHKLEADNSKFLAAFRTIGGDPLTPGVDAGGYFFLQNQFGWRIISTDEDQTINYQGNLVGEDASLPLIIVTPGRSVLHLGLQPVTQRVDELLVQQQLGLYEGVVSIDTTGPGISGTEYPAGTKSVPVNNIPDALTIAANNNFNKFLLRGAFTLPGAPGNTTWEGNGTTAIINLNGQDVSNSHFKNVQISGTMIAPTGPTVIEGSTLGAITNFCGTVVDSELTNTIILAAGECRFYNCYDDIAGGGSPIFDANNNAGIDLAIRNYHGNATLDNFTQNDSVVSLDMNSGEITIAATCTNFSELKIRGVANLINSSALDAGITKLIDTKGLIDGTDLMLIRQMVAGNATISLDDLTVTVFDEDGVTTIATFSISADGRIRTRTS